MTDANRTRESNNPMNLLLNNKKAFLIAIAVTLYLKFLLEPTAWIFYELYHLTGVEFIYWGYSGFRAGGYYFGIWPYQTLACVIVGLLVFAWGARATVKDNKNTAPETAS
jgi:hypothetical protein